MDKQYSLKLIYGQDYDQIEGQLYGAMPRHWRDNLSKLGLGHGLHDLAQTMLLCRYTPPQKRVPQVKWLAEMMGYSEAHVRDMLHSMEAAGLVTLFKNGGRVLRISISGLVKKLRGLWRKKEKPAAEKVAPRLAPKNPRGPKAQPDPEPQPTPAPEPIPFPAPAPLPPAAVQEEENELDAEIAAKLAEQEELQAILDTAPRRSPQHEEARRRWQELSRWLVAHAPLLVAVVGGG